MANYKYSQMADWLRARLQDGSYQPGQKIPTEAELAAQFSLSRHTIRQAILSLEEEGFLRRVQGSGTYVTDHAGELLSPVPAQAPASTSKVISLIMSSAQSYIFPAIAQGATEYLLNEGYMLNVMFSGNDFRMERQMLENLLRNRPAGLLIEPCNNGMRSYNSDLFAALPQRIPTIMLHKDTSKYCPVLSLRDREGGRLLTEYLLEQGHTQIGTIFAFNEQTGQSRYLGMLDALYARQLSHPEDLEVWAHRCDITSLFAEGGSLPLRRMLDRATVVFCHDDRIASTLITYLRTIGRRVPEDISVVGYDDGMYSIMDAQITTVAHPKEQYGKRAAQAILELIRSPATFDIRAYETEPKLMIRESVASLNKTPNE